MARTLVVLVAVLLAGCARVIVQVGTSHGVEDGGVDVKRGIGGITSMKTEEKDEKAESTRSKP